MNPMYSGNPALKIICILHLPIFTSPFKVLFLKAIPKYHVISTTDV